MVELIQKAIIKLNEQTELGAYFNAFENETAKGQLQLPSLEQGFEVECIKQLTAAKLQKNIAEIKLKNRLAEIVLVTEYINPNQAILLKRQKISFIDLVGNTYINRPPVYIDIQGKKAEKTPHPIAIAKQLGKAFQPKGMKVTFMLMVQPNLVNEPMRTIAEVSKVALGTVKQVMDDLIYQEFVVQKGQKTKELINPKGLLEKWLDAFPVKVDAKLNRDIYVADNPDLLRNLDLNEMKALWGGEYAAERYDNYLNAKNYLIYVQPENKNAILNAARLRKANAFEANNDLKTQITLMEPPLAIEKLIGKKRDLAHPYLVYANLLTGNDPRVTDAAGRFYERHIA